MRTVCYVAVAVAVFARSSVVAAFANADESKLLSKTAPDFAADAVISSDSRKRFLRVADPEDDDLLAADEERVKFASMKQIIAKLEKDDMKHVAAILVNDMPTSIHQRSPIFLGCKRDVQRVIDLPDMSTNKAPKKAAALAKDQDDVDDYLCGDDNDVDEAAKKEKKKPVERSQVVLEMTAKRTTHA
ncbi:hypothetical protein PHYBOEH_009318 [Phytophthora boehmeriae]|uniref:RxLR effector protein n=1 Tax=Phytophthora boehmeriae TaxID=109152 RepID=A0A8T1VY31_9STRA|nr:hypothetical protein PHYBOEH_009318 [Phytophthora boehmeriae]